MEIYRSIYGVDHRNKLSLKISAALSQSPRFSISLKAGQEQRTVCLASSDISSKLLQMKGVKHTMVYLYTGITSFMKVHVSQSHPCISWLLSSSWRILESFHMEKLLNCFGTENENQVSTTFRQVTKRFMAYGFLNCTSYLLFVLIFIERRGFHKPCFLPLFHTSGTRYVHCNVYFLLMFGLTYDGSD